jgi:hypothetical protein
MAARRRCRRSPACGAAGRPGKSCSCSACALSRVATACRSQAAAGRKWPPPHRRSHFRLPRDDVLASLLAVVCRRRRCCHRRRIGRDAPGVTQVATLQPPPRRPRLALHSLLRRGRWRVRAVVDFRDHRGDANDIGKREASIALPRAHERPSRRAPAPCRRRARSSPCCSPQPAGRAAPANLPPRLGSSVRRIRSQRLPRPCATTRRRGGCPSRRLAHAGGHSDGAPCTAPWPPTSGSWSCR